MLPWVPGNGSVEIFNSSCAMLNKESQESFRGQPSPRKHLNSLGKTREIYWKHWNDTFASFLFITWTQLGFYFQVWRRFYQHEVLLGTAEGLVDIGKLAMLRVHHGISVPRPCSIVQPSSFSKPLLTVHLNPWIHLLLLCTSRRAAHSPKHLHWPHISSALGCSFRLGTRFVYDKYLSWT